MWILFTAVASTVLADEQVGTGQFPLPFNAYNFFLAQQLGQQSPFFYGQPKLKYVNPGAYAQVDVRSGPFVINPSPSLPSDPIIVYGPQPQVPLVPLYPPPPPAVILEEELCDFDEHGNRCCNRLLKATMKSALAPITLDSCNIGLMAKLVQKKAEEVFKMDFESLAAYKGFNIKSHYVGNHTCKINRGGKSIMAFASPTEENLDPAKRAAREIRRAKEKEEEEKRRRIRDATREAKAAKKAAARASMTSQGKSPVSTITEVPTRAKYNRRPSNKSKRSNNFVRQVVPQKSYVSTGHSPRLVSRDVDGQTHRGH